MNTNNQGADSITLVSQVMTPDGTILTSRHIHDYVTHNDADGTTYGLDGGCYYQKIIGTARNLKNISLSTKSPHEEIRQFFCWGSFLNNYQGCKHWIPLYKLGDSHIRAILETQTHIPHHIKQLFLNEVEYRKQHGITVQETTKD